MIHLELARIRPYENDSLIETRPTKGLKIVQSSLNFRDFERVVSNYQFIAFNKG